MTKSTYILTRHLKTGAEVNGTEIGDALIELQHRLADEEDARLASIGDQHTNIYRPSKWEDEDIIFYITAWSEEESEHLLVGMCAGCYATATIDHLYVVEHMRGRGIGTMLLENMLTVLQANDPSRALTIGVVASNKIARKMYAKYGFTTETYLTLIRTIKPSKILKNN